MSMYGNGNRSVTRRNLVILLVEEILHQLIKVADLSPILYTCSGTKPQMVPMDLNIAFQGLAAWFRAKSTTLLIGSFTQYLQGLIDPRWWRISAINSIPFNICCFFVSHQGVSFCLCFTLQEKTRWWFQIFSIFTPIPGEMIQFDEHILQMAWNHQPENCWKKNTKTGSFKTGQPTSHANKRGLVLPSEPWRLRGGSVKIWCHFNKLHLFCWQNLSKLPYWN